MHPAPAPLPTSDQKPEMAHVLFMDLVAFSTLTMEEQRRTIIRLQEVVRSTDSFRRAEAEKQLIALPTGDGMALVFFGDPTQASECAIEISRTVRNDPAIRLRMGLHTGPVYRMADINTNLNVSGGGINLCQRIMDAGDQGHILVSSTVAEVLAQLGNWNERLVNLGEHAVKHGVRLHFFNLTFESVGNADIPTKLAGSERRSGSQMKQWLLAITASLLVIAIPIFFVLRPSWLRRATDGPAELSYWITAQRFKAGQPFRQPFELAREMIFDENYGIALNLSLAGPAYLYVLNDGPLADGRDSVNVLYPGDPDGARISDQTTARIPQEGWFIFDAQSGPEKLYVIVGKATIPTIDNLYKGPRQNGHIVVTEASRLKTLRQWLAGVVVSENRVVKERDRTIVRSTSNVFAQLIPLEHH